LGSTPALATN